MQVVVGVRGGQLEALETLLVDNREELVGRHVRGAFCQWLGLRLVIGGSELVVEGGELIIEGSELNAPVYERLGEYVH